MWKHLSCKSAVLARPPTKNLADVRVGSQDSAKIIALSNYWQDNESPGPYCGRKIQITNQGGGDDNNGVGNVVVATVEDTCPSCDEEHLGIAIVSISTRIVLTIFAARSERGSFRGLDGWEP